MPKHNINVGLTRLDLSGMYVQGYCAPRFQPVLDAFVENFNVDVEHGASLAIELDGETVVDVWGGCADVSTQRPWEHDTVGVVFSNTKAATALCAHILADQGELNIDQRVSHYWPEFAAQGKGDITVRMLLDHTAGVPALREMLPDGAVFDWAEMTQRLAAEAPYWKPGTSVGYHGLTFGWLVGEVVRRVAQQSLGSFFQERVASPLGIDFWIGLPESEESRVAPIVPAKPAEQPRNAFERAIATEPESISNLYFRNTGGWRPSGFNSRRGHAAEIGAAGGITHARALAGMYSALALGGERHGVRIIKRETLDAASEVSSATNEDLCLLVPTRFAAGFMRSMDNRARGLDSAVFGRDAFGHVGAGGSLGFASAQHRIGFGYTMNHMGAGVLLNSRANRLTEALYRVLAQR
jgi:CubicO group peptidase (beta-lactamase class C family)